MASCKPSPSAGYLEVPGSVVTGTAWSFVRPFLSALSCHRGRTAP